MSCSRLKLGQRQRWGHAWRLKTLYSRGLQLQQTVRQTHHIWHNAKFHPSSFVSLSNLLFRSYNRENASIHKWRYNKVSSKSLSIKVFSPNMSPAHHSAHFRKQNHIFRFTLTLCQTDSKYYHTAASQLRDQINNISPPKHKGTKSHHPTSGQLAKRRGWTWSLGKQSLSANRFTAKCSSKYQ